MEKPPSKRFQSGREVFEHYVPGYQDKDSSSADRASTLSAKDGRALASNLLRSLNEKLSARNKPPG